MWVYMNIDNDYNYQRTDKYSGCAGCKNRCSPNNCVGCDGKTHKKENREKQDSEQYYLDDDDYKELDFS